MDSDQLTILLGAIIKQFGGEIRLNGEHLEGVEGGLLVYEDLASQQLIIKLVSQEEFGEESE